MLRNSMQMISILFLIPLLTLGGIYVLFHVLIQGPTWWEYILQFVIWAISSTMAILGSLVALSTWLDDIQKDIKKKEDVALAKAISEEIAKQTAGTRESRDEGPLN